MEGRARFTILDCLLIPLLAAGAAWLMLRAGAGLGYRWNWETVLTYLLRYDAEAGRYVPNLLLEGFLTTVRLSFWAMVPATAIGLAMALFRTSPRLFRRMVGRSYVELVRNLPPLVLVFITYYFISDQIMAALGVDAFLQGLSPEAQEVMAALYARPAQFSLFTTALITLSLYEGAYITEIIRAGIQSVGQGQREAARALGLSRRQLIRHIIFPQALPRILPPLAGQLVSTIKDSAIVSVISIQELTFQGMEVMSATYLTFEIWITVAALYFTLTFTLSLAVSRFEAAVSRKWA
jgi:polar amino acid transport system permease protein